ncbi:MAG: hypothetical protein ACPGNV_06290 [Mangrovicoccus sp.]
MDRVKSVLVVQRNPLIAQDIEEIIKTVVPVDRVQFPTNAEACAELLGGGAAVDLVVMCLQPAQVMGAGLDKAIETARAAGVIISDEVTRQDVAQFWPYWGFTSLPFTTESLGRAISHAVTTMRSRFEGT